MGSYTIETATIINRYTEETSINDALAMFADTLFREGFLKVSTKYDKDSGHTYRELSIRASKEVYE